jgi:hypothetical protein
MPARASAYDAGRAIERPDGGGGFYPAVRTRGFRPFRGAMSVSTLGLRDESKRLTVGLVSIGRRIRVHVGLRSFTDGGIT